MVISHSSKHVNCHVYMGLGLVLCKFWNFCLNECNKLLHDIIVTKKLSFTVFYLPLKYGTLCLYVQSELEGIISNLVYK